MNIKRLTWGIMLLCTMLFAQGSFTATVDGNAFKADQPTDHSGITIQLETLPGVPTTGFIGVALLLGGLSLFFYRKRNRTMLAGSLVFAVAGLSCITYAFATYTAVTNMDGEYNMTAVDSGSYRLDASAPGYFPEQLVPIAIVDGANTIPDITLQPMTTPTPGPTDTPTNTPAVVSVGTMISISAGSFTQGSPDTEPCRYSNETQFTHTLMRNLSVMETEITRQMWMDLRAVQATLPVDPSDTTFSPSMSHPVQQITWYEAVLFANLLSLQNGYTRCYYTDSGQGTPINATNYTTGPFFCDFDANGYRLPTEGEWEYFTRAGTTTAFFCTEYYTSYNCTICAPMTHPTLNAFCVYCANNTGGTAVAGYVSPSPWSLKDVHGNVYEWCWDWYGTYPGGAQTDYTGLGSGSNRVKRGGCWNYSAQRCRSASRSSSDPIDRDYNLGFRLLRSAVVSVGTMISISAGSFTQGSPDTEPCRSSNETQFMHTLTRDLRVMETEITRQMWMDLRAVQATLPDDPSDTTYSPSMSHPVQTNTWYEAVLFANLLSWQNGYTRCYYTDSGQVTPIDATNYTTGPFFCDFDANGYRLPTEGEWEYFTRAGTTTAFSCDETNFNILTCDYFVPGTHPTLEQYCVYSANSMGTTAVAGSQLANPWSLKDVHGNVWEWCWDWYGTYPVGAQADYTGLGLGTLRVCRGGGWNGAARLCRSAGRVELGPGFTSLSVGFRLLRSID